MPLLRSETQGRLLAELFLHPDREYSLRSLAKGVGVSPPTIQRDVDRLVKAAFLHEKRVGNSRLVRAAIDHPVFQQLADIALFGYGPLAILPDILSRISGISDAFIFGSWAARYSGQAVGHVGDLDVAVIGHPPRRDLFQAAEQASRRLKIETNIQRIGPEQWEDEKDPFVASIRSSPRLQIRLFEEEAP
ncbi:winged helix-turn-helix domain-containing protein [Arthrobacter crystallopoietes]|uniref:HTH domain-containing protein n=1 Tax=Crystallibacter crystallopoietes TaxID=37928 RepID=A0A1H1FTQ8_9MICC|nr:winged helix-turn-helix domain-containing protein [Arthrobacter crystallopoietes]SDR04473.1 hypothetical protein SAMN04489742_3655 [Arthrobacter crystallopoietes]